jgi:hypothetical protein
MIQLANQNIFGQVYVLSVKDLVFAFEILKKYNNESEVMIQLRNSNIRRYNDMSRSIDIFKNQILEILNQLLEHENIIPYIYNFSDILHIREDLPDNLTNRIL